MATVYAKRLAKLEELLASKLNQPLAYLWQNDGETPEQCCIRCGYDTAQIDRLRFVRWLTSEEAGHAEPPPWDEPNPGPPEDRAPNGGPVEPPAPDPEFHNYVDLPAEQDAAAPAAPDPDQRIEIDPLDIDRRAARRLQTEKLFEATKAFAKTIV